MHWWRAMWSNITTGVAAASHGVVDNNFSGNRFSEFTHYFHYVKQSNSGPAGDHPDRAVSSSDMPVETSISMAKRIWPIGRSCTERTPRPELQFRVVCKAEYRNPIVLVWC